MMGWVNITQSNIKKRDKTCIFIIDIFMHDSILISHLYMLHVLTTNFSTANVLTEVVSHSFKKIGSNLNLPDMPGYGHVSSHSDESDEDLGM